jgi:serine/threonine protein kinase
MPPQVGQVVNNKYRLLRHIGDGGMGSVFEARHETLGTTVALKFLHLEFTRREGLVQRFLQEARASAQIQSPNVVRVTDVDQTAAGDVFIVLEYLEGKTLQALYEELYRGGRRLPYTDALDFAMQILDGVEAAHRAGIVHRDLKPDNVMIAADARGATVLKLLDFGIAKLKVIGGKPGLTRPGVMMGTPEYMAPEQTSSADAVDARADIFSLGVMIFEMLAGQRPVGGEDPLELADAYRGGRISRLADLCPSLAPDLAAAVHRAMAATPADRWASVSDMRAAIEPFAAAVRPPTPSRGRLAGTIGVSTSAPGRGYDGGPESPPNPPRIPRSAAPPPPAPPPPARAQSGAPGRVAKTWPPDGEPEPGGAHVAGTMIDNPAIGAGHGDHTEQLGAAYAPASRTAPGGSAAAAIRAAPAPGGRRRRRSGRGPLWVLLGAVAVAGIVTGAVYLSSRSSKDDDDGPPKQSSAPPPAVTLGPQPPAPPAQPFPEAPPVAPTPPQPPPTGPRPAPKPSASGSAAPSAAPPALVLPSAFPFPNPFQPAPQPSGSGSSKPQDAPPLFPFP